MRAEKSLKQLAEDANKTFREERKQKDRNLEKRIHDYIESEECQRIIVSRCTKAAQRGHRSFPVVHLLDNEPFGVHTWSIEKELARAFKKSAIKEKLKKEHGIKVSNSILNLWYEDYRLCFRW